MCKCYHPFRLGENGCSFGLYHSKIEQHWLKGTEEMSKKSKKQPFISDNDFAYFLFLFDRVDIRNEILHGDMFSNFNKNCKRKTMYVQFANGKEECVLVTGFFPVQVINGSEYIASINIS